MKNYLSVLKKTQLFSGVNDDEIETMLSCLQAEFKTYKKGEYIIRQGEPITSIMIDTVYNNWYKSVYMPTTTSLNGE